MENANGIEKLLERRGNNKTEYRDETVMWRDKFGVMHPVSEMSAEYINRCILAFKEGRIPINYRGGKDKWLKIFDTELKRRKFNELFNKTTQIINKQPEWCRYEDSDWNGNYMTPELRRCGGQMK